MEQQAGLRGYVDPRTGAYVRTTEDADPQKVHEDLAFIAAWAFYWDGPPEFDRKDWRASGKRAAWMHSLTKEQRQMLADCPPPEEVPSFGE